MEVDTLPCLFCTEHQPWKTVGTRSKSGVNQDLGALPVFVPTKDDVIIERQLMAIFILRNVLQLPEDRCCEYLKEDDGQVGPDRWFSVCSSCIKTVEKCFALEREVSQLQRQLEILKSTLRNSIHDTSAEKWNVRQPQNAICFDVRHYVTKVFFEGDGTSPLELLKNQRELKILEQTDLPSTLEMESESLAIAEEECLHHMPIRVQNSRGKASIANCMQCKPEKPNGVRPVRTQFECKKCNVRLCIQPGSSCYQKYHLQLKSQPKIGDEIDLDSLSSFTDADRPQDIKKCAFHIPVRDVNEKGRVTKSDCVQCKPHHRSLTEFRCSHCHVSLCLQFGTSCFEKYHSDLRNQTARLKLEDSNIFSIGIKKTDDIETSSPSISATRDDDLSPSPPPSISINSEDSDWHPSDQDIADDDDNQVIANRNQSKRLRRSCRDKDKSAKKFVKQSHDFSIKKPTKYRDIIMQRMKKAQKARNLKRFVLIKCEHCPAKYRSETLVKSHRDLHSSGQGLDCIKCGWHCKADKIDYHMKWHLQESVERKRIRKRGKSSTYRYYCCDVCPANFKEKFCLEEHRKLHECGEGVECLICRWSFDSEDRLKRHMKAIHSFKNSKGIPYYCDYCHMIFPVRSRVVNHFYTAHFGNKPLDCSSCSSKFESKQLLKMHRDQEHPEEKGSDVDEPDQTDSNKPHSCPHCSEIFSSKLKLDFHIASLHKDELLSCPTCKFKSTSYPTWVNHQQTHVNRKEGSFVCEICCQTFRQAGTLSAHRRRDHYKECGMEGILCKECSMSFSGKSALRNHVKAVHEKKKDYFCEYCFKGFSFNTDLQRHILLHTAPRELQYKKGPFTCEFCQAQFNVRQGLYYHVKKLHSDKFTLRCGKCGQGYCTRISLEKHQKSCKVKQ